jgi:hypothetical protein
MKPFFPFLLALGLVACGTDGTSVLTGKSRPSIAPSQVVLYLTPPAQYEAIGLVSAKSGKHGSDQGKMDDAVEELKKQAAEVGANGVVIQQTGESTTGAAGVVIQAGDVPLFFSNQHHRETINGTAIYVSPSDDVTDTLLGSTDIKSVSASAESGDPSSKYTLGMLYMQGTGIPQDYVEALKWLILAKASADVKSDIYKSASTGIDKLETEMVPAQIADAQKQASEWYKSHTVKQ